MLINHLTPNVKHWVELAFNDTPTLWSYLDTNESAMKEAVNYAQSFFDDTYPDLPFDEVNQNNIRRIRFEFFIVRHRLKMSQRSAYCPSYFNELAEQYGFDERATI